MRRFIAYLFLITSVGCYGECALFSKAGSGPTPIPVIAPAATPAPTATPTPTPTPDPCKPQVTGVNLSGPLSVVVNVPFSIDVTPVSASGPLEGALDYCNNGRVPFVEFVSPNVRCVGTCSGYKPSFMPSAVGPFEVRIRVDAASAVFAGAVTR